MNFLWVLFRSLFEQTFDKIFWKFLLEFLMVYWSGLFRSVFDAILLFFLGGEGLNLGDLFEECFWGKPYKTENSNKVDKADYTDKPEKSEKANQAKIYSKALLVVILTAYTEQLVVTFTKPRCFPAGQGCVTHVLRPKSQELGKN